MISFSSVLLILFLIFVSDVYSKKSVKIPDFLKICKRNDPKLDRCITDSLNSLKPYLARGIPEMKLLPFDPLPLAEAKFQTPMLSAHLTDNEFHAAHDFVIEDLHFDLHKNSLSMNISYGSLLQTGKYNITGRLLAFVLNGQGDLRMKYTQIDIFMKLYGKRIVKNGKSFIDFENIDYRLKFGDFHPQLDNLFANNPELTSTVNRVLNENSQSLIPDFEEICRSILGEYMLAALQRVFSTFSLDELIPK